MSESPAPLHTWLAEPMPPDVAATIERLRRAEDVCHVAVMPDVHLAKDVCVGTVLATRRALYPGAVGGDIGCGMLAMAYDADADALADASRAASVLLELRKAVPPSRRHRQHIVPYPRDLADRPLSHGALAAASRDEGTLQLGTLGSGNHFVELQRDDDGRLWLMVHSGSRAMGQAIRAHHCAAARVTGKLLVLDADTPAGQAYCADVVWARRYADANRRAIAEAVGDVMHRVLGMRPVESSLITCDHNHVATEEHHGQRLLIHRKGAMPADAGMFGVVPGSMGTRSYHVEGRGCAAALRSSAHGAGRHFSREAARQRISLRALCRQMEGVWWDYRQAAQLREEAPAAYKDIDAVLRAQHELVKITRVLRPVLAHKSG